MSQHEESTEHFFTSFTDLLVGVIFLFMLLLMVFALNLKQKPIKPAIISEQIRAQVLREIGRRMETRQTPVTLDLANGIVRLPEAQLFESGQWQLSPQGEAMVKSFAIVMGEIIPCAAHANAPCAWKPQPLSLDSVLIEGHTDKRPFSNAQGYGNWELSAFRAITVYRAMVEANPALEQSLNPGSQPILGISAYADRRPVDTNDLDPNRRIDIRFNMHATNYKPQPANE